MRYIYIVLDLIRNWWFVSLLIWLPFWATKTYDKTWFTHIIESLFAISVVLIFLGFLYWISGQF